MSPLLHIPMVGVCTAGNATGGATQDSGGTLARYQLRAGVRVVVASTSVMTASESGWRAQERRLAPLLSLSHRAPTPATWENSVEQDVPCCATGRRNVRGGHAKSKTR